MTWWLVHRNPAHHRARKRAGYRRPLDLPSPAVNATGLDGDNRSHTYLEDDLMPTAPRPAPPADRPPYQPELPMARLAEIPLCGLTAVSTFTGAGGGCLGLRWAGISVRAASEFVPAARETYQANWPDCPVDARDIRTVTGAELLDLAGLAAGQVDLLEGSPPCASFSTAGSRSSGWGRVRAYSDTAQQTDDLFGEYARLLTEIRPRAFIAENVTGLTKGVAKGYFKEILAALRACGYTVEARLLNSEWLGVPQVRTRVFFVGVRADLDRPPAWPVPLRYRYGVVDALPHLAGGQVHMPPRGKFAGRHLNLDDHEPSATIAVSKGGARRQHQVAERAVDAGDGLVRRTYTIAELRRICGFPDDYQLTGSFNQQWERLGRAVAPPVMRAVAVALRDHVLLPARAAAGG